jgi:tRNA dimethylallyltransferase
MSDTTLTGILHKITLQAQEELLQILSPIHRRAIILAGATGAGKSYLALQLAQKINGEIVSADSVQVYKGMDIGTAKVSIQERAKVPHHLIDICDITEAYHVVQFYEDAKRACQNILRGGKVPIVCGGTGFYIHTLIYGPPEGPEANPAIREALEKDVEKFGIDPLFERLQEFDPVYAATITANDLHKVIRALEIIEITGRPVSSFKRKDTPEGYFDFRCWYLSPPRELLYKELERRCDRMLKEGLLEEVLRLDRMGIRRNKTASQAIGYKQTLEFFDTAQTAEDYEHFVAKFKQATRHLVKRQTTWFKKEKLFRWVNPIQYTTQELIDLIVADYQSDTPSILTEE